MPLANVRGAKINYEILGTRGEWIALTPGDSPHADGTVHYALDLAPDMCGKLDGRIRAYPCHPLLTHPFELGLMIWA